MLFRLLTADKFEYKGVTYKTGNIIETNVNLIKRYKKSKVHNFERVVGGTFQTIRIMPDGTTPKKKRKANWRLGKNFKKVESSSCQAKFIQVGEETKTERKISMRKVTKVVTHYIDEETGKETEQAVLPDTSGDCHALNKISSGVRVGNIYIFADGSTRNSGGFQRPAPLGGEFPMARLQVIRQYWQIVWEGKTSEFNYLKARLEAIGETFEIRGKTYQMKTDRGTMSFTFLKKEGASTDALTRIKELKVEVEEAAVMYDKAEKDERKANPRVGGDRPLNREDAERQQEFAKTLRSTTI